MIEDMTIQGTINILICLGAGLMIYWAILVISGMRAKA